MKTPRLLWTSSALCLMLASCDKTKPSTAAPENPQAADELAAERAALEDERLALERERLEAERAALEEEKEALRAEREARLASREEELESGEMSLEERQRELDERDASLGDREGDLAQREANLSDQELELAGSEPLDDWEPDYEPEVYEPVADYGTFYDDLQSYGSWYETPDYGYVYQPTVVVQDTSWRPYTRGRWACTNLGWNWVSDEPFGWACFHYGRWTLLDGRGWVWVPGDEWAPSWVCWREGGEHVGWAPLPPETLCYRGRGWSSSVEADFGIGSSCFSFVHRRHMADHLWRHCLPLAQNSHCIQRTANITNIQFHRDRIVSGGPRYDRLRREVGKPWPVYQIETDRFRALKDLNRRNANIRGNQIAVFAPNLNAQWNGQLKPSRLAGKWDAVKVVRAESGIKPEWTERFREARQKQKARMETKEKIDPTVARTLLEKNRERVAAAQEKLQAKQQAQTEARRAKLMIQREEAKEKDRKLPGAVTERPGRNAKPGGEADTEDRKLTLAERQRQAVERLREARAQRNLPGAESMPARETPPGRVARDREPAGRSREEAQDRQPEVSRERPAITRETPAPGRQEQARQKPALPEGVTRRERPEQPARGQDQAERAAEQAARREQMEEARQQQQEEARQRREQARNDTEQSNRRQQMEEARRQQEQTKGNAEENTRRERMEEARRQQQEAAREKAEQARQQQQQMEEARRNQQEEARARQEQSRREAEEGNRRQQQEEMRRQQQEQARQEREENARRQQEEQARQQERMREQQEERARQQEEARREQEERSRQQQEERARQQEERARQQEEARREAQERARQQQEEQQRRQEERAREQEEKKEERQRGR